LSEHLADFMSEDFHAVAFPSKNYEKSIQPF
jgi:hypothetical protein